MVRKAEDVIIMENRIYAFVDNSNIFIEGQKHYGKIHGDHDLGRKYRLDFGKLFDHISKDKGEIFFDKNNVQYPKLYGSEPPKMDSLWKYLESMGVDVQVFKRNAFNKEKGVDFSLAWNASRLIFDTENEDNSNNFIVIVGGDADFFKVYDEGTKIGYNVEYYCWEHSASHEIKELPTFHNLTPYIDKIGYVEPTSFHHDFRDTNWSKKVPYDE